MCAKPWSNVKHVARISRTHDDAWADEIDRKVLAELHPDQRNAADDDHRRVVATVGRGGGKTTMMKARAVRKLCRIPRCKLVYIATTRMQAEDLMWNGLKDALERLGVEATFNETKLRCTIKRNGSQIRLVGADDKREIDKLRGQSFHEVYIDEAASYPVALLENLLVRVIGPRLGDLNGSIVMGGTPGHILAGEFYEATRPGGKRHRPWRDRDNPDYAGWLGWSSHHWTLEDAARHVPAMARLWAEALRERADRGWTDEHPVWKREYLGLWAADDSENIYKYRAHVDGVPFNQWDPPRHGPSRIAVLPERDDWSYGIGLDLGHSDPFACQVFAFSPSDPTRTLYQVYEYEATRMYPQTIATLLIGEEHDADNPSGLIGEIGWPAAGIVCDLAGQGDSFLDEMRNVYGIHAIGADKAPKYKFPAIEMFNGDLLAGRIKVLKGSKLETQLLTLQWQIDEFGRLKEDKGQANHSTDAAIYIRRQIATMFSGAEAAPAPKQRAPEPVDIVDPPAMGDEFKEWSGGGLFDEDWGESWNP